MKECGLQVILVSLLRNSLQQRSAFVLVLVSLNENQVLAAVKDEQDKNVQQVANHGLKRQ